MDLIVEMTLIRHGQVPGNIDRKFIGVTDESLTQDGRDAIKDKARRGEYPEADLVAVSPLMRCIETAKLIYPELEPLAIDELREMNFGIFENKSHKELVGDPVYQAWLDSGGHEDFPGGEPIRVFIDRVMKGFRKTLSIITDRESCLDANKPFKLSLVVHGGTIMAIQSELKLCDFYDRMFENGDMRTIKLQVSDSDVRVIEN